MGAGGMHDHIGGGFHRYSVDRYWHVRISKDALDQAQLAVAYLNACIPAITSILWPGRAAKAPVRWSLEEFSITSFAT